MSITVLVWLIILPLNTSCSLLPFYNTNPIIDTPTTSEELCGGRELFLRLTVTVVFYEFDCLDSSVVVVTMGRRDWKEYITIPQRIKCP